MMNGRGSTPLRYVDAKHSAANTADCPTSHQRLRTSITTAATTISSAETITVKFNGCPAIDVILRLMNGATRADAHDGRLSWKPLNTISSYDCPSSVRTAIHHAPNEIAIISTPNTAHSTRLDTRGCTVSGSRRANPRLMAASSSMSAACSSGAAALRLRAAGAGDPRARSG